MNEIIIDLNLAPMEKEALREFLQLKQDNAPMMFMGAQQLARQLDVTRPRAYMILSQLEDKKLVQKIDRKGFLLTEKGNKVMNELLHRTKILETYFYNELGLPLEAAAKEATQIVLYVSFQFIEILCDKLGKPASCPHNIEIPHHKKHEEIGFLK
jgi:DtxR family transcriptional regulator, Mn-dependent transcriptional regulator